MDLKPCPFCGAIPECEIIPITSIVTGTSRIEVKIQCRKCGIFVSEKIEAGLLHGIYYKNFLELVSKVVKKWDRRADDGT